MIWNLNFVIQVGELEGLQERGGGETKVRGSVLKANMHISCQVKKIALVLIVLDLEVEPCDKGMGYGDLRGPDLPY